MEIAGLDEEFEKYFSEGRTPENLDGEEVIRDLGKINIIPEEKVENLKAAILKEYRVYWLEKEELYIDACEYNIFVLKFLSVDVI